MIWSLLEAANPIGSMNLNANPDALFFIIMIYFKYPQDTQVARSIHTKDGHTMASIPSFIAARRYEKKEIQAVK
jgi:hypothetical protein